MNQETSRRVKRFYLSENKVLGLLRLGQFVPGDCLRLTHPVEVPESAIVLSVHHDYIYNSFCFMVQDESFEEVPEGCEPPQIHVTFQTICLPIPVTQ